MFRPWTRAKDVNHNGRQSPEAITPVRPVALDLAEVLGPSRPRASPSWSPHLWHNRASLARRRTIFQAPMPDEQAEGKVLSKRTAQISLFAFGFIFPPGDYDPP